jgi:hypothetical protein
MLCGPSQQKISRRCHVRPYSGPIRSGRDSRREDFSKYVLLADGAKLVGSTSLHKNYSQPPSSKQTLISDFSASPDAFRHVIRINRWQELSKKTLITLFASCADFDLAAPFRLQNLGRCDTSARIGVENRIDNVSTTCLEDALVQEYDTVKEVQQTLCNASIGAYPSSPRRPSRYLS